MKEKPSCRCTGFVLLIILSLVLSSSPTLHARFRGNETGVEELVMKEPIASQTDQRMGEEICDGGGGDDDEECMKKRVISESEIHLDYIYTQHQRH